jgi:hypothetical protein
VRKVRDNHNHTGRCGQHQHDQHIGRTSYGAASHNSQQRDPARRDPPVQNGEADVPALYELRYQSTLTMMRPIEMSITKPKLISAQIEKNGVEFVEQKLNLKTKWPVLMDEDKWNESFWNSTDFHRFSVDFFVDTDLKNTSRRALYVSVTKISAFET